LGRIDPSRAVVAARRWQVALGSTAAIQVTDAGEVAAAVEAR
jgi:hypothetical protein